MNGGDTHRWRVILSDWEPDLWATTYETCVVQECQPCGRVRALLWDARGKRLPVRYKWNTGRAHEEGENYHRFTADDHRDRLLNRVRELEAEQRKARAEDRKRKASAKQGKATQRKAA